MASAEEGYYYGSRRELRRSERDPSASQESQTAEQHTQTQNRPRNPRIGASDESEREFCLTVFACAVEFSPGGVVRFRTRMDL